MSSELQALYQEVIMDHYKRPRNWGALEKPDRHVDGHNPLCGDRITVDLALDGETVKDVRCQGTGCAISVASASVMSEIVKGKSRAEIDALFEKFHDVVIGKVGEVDQEQLGKLAVFAGVAQFPARVKCATLAWHAVIAALESEADSVTTE